MSKWIVSGLRTGIKTTRYPRELDEAPGVSPGLPAGRALVAGETASLTERCPTGALALQGDRIAVDVRRCVHCFRCAYERGALVWESGCEWASKSTERASDEPDLGLPFSRSIHVRVIDAGDCGACLHEVKQLTNPYYNVHRLGFFLTPTPRLADILLIVGAGTEQMREALEKAYTAMPTPRKVIAAGACALTGGIFGPSFASSAGVGGIVPVDIEVPGNPPPPLAILHALLLATGRAAATPTEWTGQ